MSKTTEKAVVAPPYVSYKTFHTFLEGLKASGMPSRIDRGVMGNMSAAVQAHLISALNSLNLVTSTGQPTPTLDKLVHSDGKEREKLLNGLLRTSFPFLFEAGFKIETDTAKHFDEQFNKAGLSFETARKCKAFFLAAAKDAGIEPSSYILKGSRGQKASTRKSRVKSNTKNGQDHQGQSEERPTDPGNHHERIAAQSSLLLWGLFQRLPKPGTQWAKADREQWTQTLQNVLTMEYPEK